MNEKLYRTHVFGNGIRLIHKENTSEVAHFGLIVHTGTRDENEKEHGLAHFMEHMFFKGTHKRSAFQIISRLENVGGEINAYTTKEETAIYASFLRQDYRRAVELIQDIFINSKFSDREREKEAEVILNEIQNYEDSPGELIFDHAEEVLFPRHAIGRNILGSEESLKRFRNGALELFLKENYPTTEIVLSSIGNISFERLVNLAGKYFSDIPQKERMRKRVLPRAVSGQKINVERNTFQTHCILITEAYSLHDENRLKLYLLNNILGGPGMNSRLNMALRERRGYSYSAESHFAPYLDTGAQLIYFSCDRGKFSQCMQVTREELKKLRTKLIPDNRLANARKQLLGQLAIAYENSEHLMLTMGKSYLLFDKVDTLQDIYQKLEAISARDLRDTANLIFTPDRLNMLIYK
jgi:predicted Zn-dependent peptidase